MMEFLRNNKGVIIFYIMLALFTFILTENTKNYDNINRSYVMVER